MPKAAWHQPLGCDHLLVFIVFCDGSVTLHFCGFRPLLGLSSSRPNQTRRPEAALLPRGSPAMKKTTTRPETFWESSGGADSPVGLRFGPGSDSDQRNPGGSGGSGAAACPANRSQGGPAQTEAPRVCSGGSGQRQGPPDEGPLSTHSAGRYEEGPARR